MTSPVHTSAALSLAALAVVAAGCGSSDSEYSKPIGAKAAAKATATASPAKTGKTKKAAARPDSDGNGIPDVMTIKGAVGDTLALEGSGLNDDVNDHRKTKIRVTLKALKGPFTGFDIPAGRKLVGVELRFTNTGKLRYDDALPQGQLTLKGGETGKQTGLIPLSGKNPCDNPSLKLKTGQSKSVCIAFEIPKKGKAQAFQYVTDHGYGDTGLWKLR
jgi:hypothetical protein